MKTLSLIAVAVMLTVAASGHGSVNDTISGASVAQTEMKGAEGAGNERQLADEITRRLRRMGFNMIRNRLARPAETIGMFC